MASLRKRGKLWYYRFVDADGVKREHKGCTDKRVTEELARAAESKAAKVKAGTIDPEAEAFKAHHAKPMTDHLADWHASLTAKGHTAKHADQSSDRVRRLVAIMFEAKPDDVDGKTMTRPQQEQARLLIARLVEKARLADLTVDRVQSTLATLRDSGRSLQTCNHYRACARAFTHWAWKARRLRSDPLIGLAGYNAKEDRRHDRRTVSLEELRRLIEVAQSGPAYQSMSGPARSLCYRLAATTGLRYSEIGSILPESFDWKAPSVTVGACYTKNGQMATLPIPIDLADDLRRYVESLASGSPVFPLPAKGSDMLQVDLAVAGIPYVDASGLYFDFHSLRCQMATNADAAGVTPRVVQRLMRHSTLELTGRYTKPRVVDIEAAARMLPSLRPEGDKPESLAATGTNGQIHKQTFAHHLPTEGDASRHDLSLAGVIVHSIDPTSTNEKPLISQGFDASSRLESSSVANTPDWIRTSNLRFRRPMLYPVELRVRMSAAP
jgi:integrase